MRLGRKTWFVPSYVMARSARNCQFILLRVNKWKNGKNKDKIVLDGEHKVLTHQLSAQDAMFGWFEHILPLNTCGWAYLPREFGV